MMRSLCIGGRTPFSGAPRGIPVVRCAIRHGVTLLRREISNGMKVISAKHLAPKQFEAEIVDWSTRFVRMIDCPRWRSMARKLAAAEAGRMLRDLHRGR